MNQRMSAAMLLLIVLPGLTQTPVKDPRLATISDERVRSILREMPFEFREDSTGGTTAFAIQLDGHPVTLTNQVNGLGLSACFEGAFDPMKANEWNRKHFSTGIRLNENGRACLRAEVTFGGGSTDQMIRDFVRGFYTDVVVVARFLASTPSGSGLSPAVPTGGSQPPGGLASPIGAMAWSQLSPYVKLTPAQPSTAGPDPGVLKIAPNVSLKYDPDQWRPMASPGDGQFAFSRSSSGAQALVISEPTAVPLDAIQDVALANAQSVDPNATMVFRYRKWVKGVAWWFLKIKATVGNIPMVYWGYFYAGEGGTVQIVTYTEKSRLPEYEKSFTDFLDGLTISR